MKEIDWSCKHDIMIRNEDGTLTPMDEPYYESEEIAPGTWKIVSSGDWSYLLAGDGQGLLIDSGYGAGNIRAYAEQLCGMPVPWIANTHDHFDHTANDSYFDLAYMSAATAEKATIPFQSFAGIDFPRDYPKKIITTGDIIPLPGREIIVLAVSDHAAGSLCFLDRRERILFSGDELWDFKPLQRSSVAHFAKDMGLLEQFRSDYDRIAGGGQIESAVIVDNLLRDAERVLAGERGEEPHMQQMPPQEEEHDSEGHLIYDRHRPHPGDGGAGKIQHPDLTHKRVITTNGYSMMYDETRIQDDGVQKAAE